VEDDCKLSIGRKYEVEFFANNEYKLSNRNKVRLVIIF
jgi:hypothetical protein